MSAVQLTKHDELAGGVYRWYTSKPDPHSRPGWLPWQIRATRRQTGVIAYGGFLASASMSLYAFVMAFSTLA